MTASTDDEYGNEKDYAVKSVFQRIRLGKSASLFATGFALTIGLAHAGCSEDGALPGADLGANGCTDGDGDGYGDGCVSGSDCDDGDPTVTDDCYRCQTPGQAGCPCSDDGERVACGKVEHDLGESVTCGFGETVCADGTWNECIVNNSRLVKKPDGEQSTNGLGSPQSCASNPCDPYCQEFDDTPGGADAGDGGAQTDDGGVTITPAGCISPPANVCAQAYGNCSHDVCTAGAALPVDCDKSTRPTGWVDVLDERFRNNGNNWSLRWPWAIGAAVPSTWCSGGEDPGNDHTPTTDRGLAGIRIGSCVYSYHFYPSSDTTNTLAYRTMKSPVLDLRNYTNADVSFWHQLRGGSGIRHRVVVLNQAGTSILSTLRTYNSVSIGTWQRVTNSLASYAGQQIRLGFLAERTGSSSTYKASWSVDDVVVRGYDPTPVSFPADNLGACIQTICDEVPSCCTTSWTQECIDLVGCYCVVDDPDLSSCATETATAELAPVDLMFMLDRSCSMGSGSPTRWSTVRSATIAFVNSPDSDGMGMALSMWNSSAPLNATMAQLPAAGANITNLLNNTGPSGGTRADYAMTTGRNHVNAIRSAPGYDRLPVMVLATDGAPAEGPAPAQAIISQLWNNDGIPTFVIGIGTAAGVTTMNNWAAAGGTNQAIIAAPNDASSFLNALNQIRAQSVECDFPIPTPMSGTIDPTQVNVVYTPGNGAPTQIVTKVNDASICNGMNPGWYFDDNTNPSRIELCPGFCGTVQADTAADIEIVFGCTGQTIPGKPGLPTATFDRKYDVTGTCENGTKPRWGLWSWTASTPGDSTIEFLFRTGDTQAELDMASWTAMEFTNPPGPSALNGDPLVAAAGSPDTQSGSSNVDAILEKLMLPRQNNFVEIRMVLNPTSDGTQSPAMQAWNQQVSCVPAE